MLDREEPTGYGSTERQCPGARRRPITRSDRRPPAGGDGASGAGPLPGATRCARRAARRRTSDTPTRDRTEHDRRTIYMIYKRNLILPFMQVFDSPDTLLSCARREQSTHAPQALELLNEMKSDEGPQK